MKRCTLRIERLEDRTVPTLIPKSYVVAIDGLRGDGILNANAPNMQSLINGTWGDGPGVDYRGAWADFAQTIPDAVTVSGPNHTSIFTGVFATKHGVTGNNNAQMAAVTYPDYIQLVKLNDPTRKGAKLATWAPDLLVPSGADFTSNLSDAANAALAASILAGTPGTAYTTATGTTQIDLLFDFFDDLDAAGHSSGFSPGNPNYRAELAQIDGQIGLALNAIKNRPTFAQEDWQIIITSDHGGRMAGHGFAGADNYTIPFIVSSRSVQQGVLTGTPGNVDVLPTVLTHFDVPIPANIDGVARGSQVRTFPTVTPETDRVTHLKFDFNLNDSSGNNLNATIGGGTPTYVAGKYGQAISLNAATGDWLTLGNPASLQFGAAQDFSVALWYKADTGQNGMPLILSNKNWNIAASPGFALVANQGTGRSVTANAGDGSYRRDWDYIDADLGQWVYIAASFDRDGNGMLYLGSNGTLYKLAEPISSLGNINTALAWNIGQDGTHAYAQGLTAAIDDLSIWRRELQDSEVRSAYQAGLNAPTVPPLVAQPDSYTVNEDSTLTVPAPGLVANDRKDAITLYTENFESVPLGPAVDEAGGDGTDFTHTPPTGWTVNNSGVPGNGTANDGVTEWAGWSFADKNFWITVSGNQNRSDFTRGSGVVAVADPDEWDDLAHASGTYNTFMTTPAINFSNLQANSLALQFDSSFRPEGNQQAVLDVSYDNFVNSTRILSLTTQDLRNDAVNIPLLNSASGTVKFRFGLINAGNNWWWAVDNIKVIGVPTNAAITATLVTPPSHGTLNLNPNGSFQYTPNANFSGTDTFTYSANNGVGTTEAPVTLTVLPRPDVANVVINNGDSQRMRVSTIAVTFDGPVTLLPGAFSLTRTGGGALGVINVSTAIVNNATVATLTFDGTNSTYGSLTNGYWTLLIDGAKVQSTAGLTMANYSRNNIKRFYGDYDLNGLVDAVDFAILGGYFGSTFAPGSNPFDFNLDGTINAGELAEFGNQFGRTL